MSSVKCTANVMERGGFRMRRKSVRHKWEKLLVRKVAKFYGTRWCAACSMQKAVLSDGCSSWERFYIDCDSLRNVLECSTVKKIPCWRVAGKWYIGAQSEASLKQLLESTGQGMQRWDVAEFTRRHWRRGKWAKEEFANAVKRSILIARATAAAATPPVLHDPKASNIPTCGEGLNDGQNFTAHSSARGLILLALAAVSFTQENLQKFLQAVTPNGTPLKLQKSSLPKTSAKATVTDSHDEDIDSFENDEQKFAAAIELRVCKDEVKMGQDQHTRLNSCVGRFSSFGRNSRLMARQNLMETVVREGEYVNCRNMVVQDKVSHLHQLVRLSEVSGMRLKRSLSTFLQSLCSGLQKLEHGVRFIVHDTILLLMKMIPRECRSVGYVGRCPEIQSWLAGRTSAFVGRTLEICSIAPDGWLRRSGS